MFEAFPFFELNGIKSS